MTDNIIRADGYYKFRLIVEARTSWHGTRTVKIFQDADNNYFMSYAGQRLALADATVKSRIESLKTIDVSQPSKPVAGVDGTSYRVIIGARFKSLTFEWWADEISENWRPLIELRENILQLCQVNFGVFDDSNAHDWMKE